MGVVRQRIRLIIWGFLLNRGNPRVGEGAFQRYHYFLVACYVLGIYNMNIKVIWRSYGALRVSGPPMTDSHHALPG